VTEDAPIAGIEWVQDDSADNADNVAPPVSQVPTAAKGLFGLLCLALLLVGFVTLRSHERVEAPSLPATPVPTPTLDLDSFADPAVQGRFEATLATLPDLTLVLPQFDGTTAIRVRTGSQPAVDTSTFQDLHSLTVDVSGHWVAGLSGRPDLGTATIWVGPANEQLRPLADSVGGYAWHETEAGRIAFSADGAVVVQDLSMPLATEQVSITSPHHLERWGSWGFVMRPQPNRSGFHVLSADGHEVATGYQGSVVGSINQRLIVNLAGGRRSPLFVFADTGQAWPVFALTDMQHARSVVSGGIDDAIALHVSSSADNTHEIRLFPGNGDPQRVLAVQEQTGAVTWSEDGSTLYYLSQGADSTAVLYSYDMNSASLTGTPIGTSPNINYWQSAIAIGP